MRTLALVPARAGSKGIPHKNTRDFLGKPLVAHAIEVGKATCDKTVVSTDDVKVAEIAARYDVPVIWRPAELALDETPMLPVIQHALTNEAPDVVVLLQPTSPSVNRAAYVKEALAALVKTHADSVVSVTEIPAHMSPQWAVEVENHCRLVRFGTSNTAKAGLDGVKPRRQDCRWTYYRNGLVYAIRRKTIEMGQLYGYYCAPLFVSDGDAATIDTEQDWALAEAKHG